MMSTTRLKTVYKQEQNHRKYVCVMNDVAKSRQALYEGYLDKEKHESAQRSHKAIVITRRNVVRQQVLQTCMRSTREAAQRQRPAGGGGSDQYGRYNGLCVEQIAASVDTCLEYDHPRRRRQRRLEQLVERGYARGTLLDNETAKQRVHEYFQKPLFELYTGYRNDTGGRADHTTFLPPLASGFYTGDVDPQPDHMNQTTRSETVVQYLSETFDPHRDSAAHPEAVADNMSVQSEIPLSTVPLSTKKLRPITLPPMKVGTDNSTAEGKPKSDCIEELIVRLNRAKDKRERDTKVRKEKRAKRLQAERVHGFSHNNHEARVEHVTGNTLFVEGRSRAAGQPGEDCPNPRDPAHSLPPLWRKSSAAHR